jgi:hypothetical protein
MMFMMKCSRLDISHAVGVVSGHMENPEHWKWVLQYLRGTSITYNGCSDLVCGYVDSDLARDFGSALGKFYFASKETRIHSTTSYARICVEMDFSKGFLAEIILGCKNYTWTQKLDYERISLRCRACFETGHIAAQCTKGNRKAGKQQRKSTWWEGSNEDHQLIITNI